MTSSKTDLRDLKTQASIKREFLALLQEKPIEKISVTELAKKALINKGTFYLHYQDIYMLYEVVIAETIADFCQRITVYDTFFTNPETFAKELIQGLSQLPLEKNFPYLKPLDTRIPVPIILTEELKKHLYATGNIVASTDNDIKLEYVLLSLFTISYRYGKDQLNQAVATISQAITSLFGEA